MNDNKELNDNLQRLFSTIKDAYGIASMIKDIKEKEVVSRVNKDYEIVSYTYNNFIYKKTAFGEYTTDTEELIHPLGLHPECMTDIFSAKRLSDNQEFKKGELTDEGKIKSFYEEDNILWVRTEEKGGAININGIEKVKERKVLFTTFDGQEIYEDDNEGGWYVRLSDYFIGHQNWFSPSCKNHKDIFKYFSTEENAKTYIYHRKPCLSYNDAVHWLASDGSGYGLYKIVKEKIDKQ